MTTYKSLSYILVSPLDPKPKVITAVDSVVTASLGSMLFNFFYRNRSSKYITEPYREYYGGLVNRLGI